MRIKSFKRIPESEYKDAPEWFTRVMGSVNDHLENLALASSGNLGLVENGNNEEIEIALSHNSFLEIALKKVRGKPRGAILIDNGTPGFAELAFDVVNQSAILVKVRWETDPGTPTRCRILVIGN